MSIVFHLMIFFIVGLFGGWVARIDHEHRKADEERVAEATQKRQAYDEQGEFIKQINRNNLINTWVAESKGGVKR